MIAPSAAAVDSPDEIFVRRVLGQRQVAEYALPHGRAADIAQAHEQHRDLAVVAVSLVPSAGFRIFWCHRAVLSAEAVVLYCPGLVAFARF